MCRHTCGSTAWQLHGVPKKSGVPQVFNCCMATTRHCRNTPLHSTSFHSTPLPCPRAVVLRRHCALQQKTQHKGTQGSRQGSLSSVQSRCQSMHTSSMDRGAFCKQHSRVLWYTKGIVKGGCLRWYVTSVWAHQRMRWGCCSGVLPGVPESGGHTNGCVEGGCLLWCATGTPEQLGTPTAVSRVLLCRAAAIGWVH